MGGCPNNKKNPNHNEVVDVFTCVLLDYQFGGGKQATQGVGGKGWVAGGEASPQIPSSDRCQFKTASVLFGTTPHSHK